MSLKPRPNHAEYIRILRRMSPGQRLQKAFDLGDFSRALFAAGLRKRYPELTDEKLQSLVLKRLARCHNRNY